MDKKTLRFGLVGAGRIADSWLQAFNDLPDARLTGIADVSIEAARALAARAECAAYDSYRKLNEAEIPDAVIICTPPATHAEIAIYFLERGIHVICEKPLSVDVNSARLMLATARQHGALLTMGSKFRFVDDVARARNIIRSGILGEILQVENTFAARVDMSGRWNSNPAMAGGGVIIDNGTHSVDIMRYLLGPITEVQVVEGPRQPGCPVEDTVRMFVRSGEGVLGCIDLSWQVAKELPHYISVYGSQGAVTIGWKSSEYRQHGSREWIRFGNGYDKVQAFRGQLANFCAAIRGEEMLLIGPDDALASVEVIEAAYIALNTSTWTRVSLGFVDDAGIYDPEEVMA